MTSRIKTLITTCFILVFSFSNSNATTVSLNSSNTDIIWQIKPQDEITSNGFQLSTPGVNIPDFVKGVVPGVVFTAYVEAGLEKDPNYSDNIYKVDETFYNRPFWYRTEFELPKSYTKGQKVWLHFDGTNRFADFYFNGKKISGDDNSTKDVSGHMLRSKFNITDLINIDSKNAVAVLITDADQKKTKDAKGSFGIASSPTYLAAAGWDWMPYVPGRLAGIIGNAYVKITEDVTMEDPWIRTDLMSLNTAEVIISSDIKNSSFTAQKVIVSGTIQPGNIKFSKQFNIDAGETRNIIISKKDFPNFIINNPKLWWPNGYGEPNLYSCNIRCIVDDKISDERDINFGIKKYEYQTFYNASGWPVMTFYINGQKLFLKGGNWGMSEYLLRCQGEEYEQKIILHKDMNYNMIRLWTGCVTDDAFYDYCDKHGIMVWDDFWLYVAHNEVEQPDAFKSNARDKVRRLRNHPSIALWCGANETHPNPDLDSYLRSMVAKEDNNDRMYKSCSNQDGLSGSGWWGNQPPKHHFENSGSNLAWDKPPYPYGSDRGYGLRTEIGTATFPNYESVIKFIPEDKLWPLPTDKQLKEEDDNVWNRHFFGKEASNANPINYKTAVNTQFGESNSLQEFCEKAQLLNIEVMKGMYEAWNDKMWNDATGILIWMSQSAYPSFVWQTYDYYYDATGSYWGAKKACEPIHIQWNSSNNSVKVVNTTSSDLSNLVAKATIYDLNGNKMSEFGKTAIVDVKSSDISEAFKLNFNINNLANFKKAVASSSTQSGNASLIVDGGAGSRWESDYSDPQWIYIDLEKKEKIDKIVLKWEAAHAKEYEIQLSDDGKKWKTIYQESNCQGGTEIIKLKPIKTRFVKLNCKSRATNFGYSIYELEIYNDNKNTPVLTPLHFINLELTDSQGKVLSENTYWRNGEKDQNFIDLAKLQEANLSCKITNKSNKGDNTIITLEVTNSSNSVAFANRLRLINKKTQERILPIITSDNYFTLMPNEKKIISVETKSEFLKDGTDILLKQYSKTENRVISID
ncbi:MAG: beta-mannosidase [Bacteroidales bacterium 36-12]|nr:MAG: beta-mannosidase [Bacteroidales bacterium 36-12]